MSLANPAVLRNLVDQYQALAALRAEDGCAAARQRLRDVAYTLCVSTDTRDIDSALAAARRLPSRPGPVAAGRPPG
ncbi:DUF5133 domain-containing protein [Streptomyces sp. NPDC012751]|uniref:DUF5133 domain-containing protein n=1 Tax=Streptomyces sp. NPDC012751 TaxID=3364846 RepID=UPI0036A000FD